VARKNPTLAEVVVVLGNVIDKVNEGVEITDANNQAILKAVHALNARVDDINNAGLALAGAVGKDVDDLRAEIDLTDSIAEGQA
jgi:hypothetical protein